MERDSAMSADDPTLTYGWSDLRARAARAVDDVTDNPAVEQRFIVKLRSQRACPQQKPGWPPMNAD
jgi:hypothetical protein